MRLGVAIPSHGMGNLAAKPLHFVQQCPLVEEMLPPHETTSSALTYNHNDCWCWGLNEFARKTITHLLIMHSDVRPLMPHWIEVLATQMEEANADALGSFIVIKHPLGVTSTGLDTDYWYPQRLSLAQAKQLPVTWTSPTLLVNTGLLLIDIAKFVDRGVRICFTMHDDIYQDAEGFWHPRFVPEDWDFSRQCRAQGVRLFVSRGIAIEHSGIAGYPNSPAWGVEVDPVNVKSEPIIVTDAHGETMEFDPSYQSGPPKN